MADKEWHKGLRALGVRFAGDAIEELNERGNPIEDDTFLLLFNTHHERVLFTLPAHKKEIRWEPVLDTRGSINPKHLRKFKGGQKYDLGARTLALLRLSQVGNPRPGV